MFIHSVEAREHGAELLGTNCDHRRQADRRLHGIATANPVPETKNVGAVDSKRFYTCGIGRDRDKMPRNGFFIAQRVEHPLASGVGIRHCFEGGERFGTDDE